MTNHDKWWQRNNYIIPQKGVFSITLKNILVVSSISDLTLEFCVIFINQVFRIWAKLKKFYFKIFNFGQFWPKFALYMKYTLSAPICHDKSWQRLLSSCRCYVFEDQLWRMYFLCAILKNLNFWLCIFAMDQQNCTQWHIATCTSK